MYALADCNNFYASCERVFNPTLNGKPVVVLSNNDGCVIARSNEAKAVGIRMGDPAFQIERLIRTHDVQVFSSNFVLYGDMSRRVMNILASYTPSHEIYSIDECFLDLSGMTVDLREYGLKMRRQVGRWTGIPLSVGIAPTKALAKVANRIAKKYPELQGVHVIDSEEKRIKALRWLAIEDVWGIGRRYARKLRTMGVNTAYDFTQLPESMVRALMTVVGRNLQRDLQGIPTLEMEIVEKKQSIATTRSFDRDYNTLEDLHERIATFVVTSAEKLRRQQSMCRRMMVFIETNRFNEKEEFYANSVLLKLPFPTSSSLELVPFAIEGLKSIYREHKHYKRAGVILLDLVDANAYQPSLFFNSDPKHKKLMEAMDRLNRKHGKTMVRLASQDELTHKMRRLHLSRAYTTSFNELIEVQL
jgi:DNA polymerase V